MEIEKTLLKKAQSTSVILNILCRLCDVVVERVVEN